MIADLGLSAIVTETHTGSSKHTGVWTAVGDDAVTAWWLCLMVWLFLPFVVR